MSRIHEALKKAEQEKAAGLMSDAEVLSPTIVPVTTERPLEEDGVPPAVHVAVHAAASAKTEPVAEEWLRVSDLVQRCAKPTWHPDPRKNIFLNSEDGIHGSERFRTLRSRLYQIRATRALRSVIVTSAVPGEGKTFIACNLAQIIVRQPDRRVLLIDADMRCPQLHLALGAPKGPGLSDYLRGEARLEAIVQQGNLGNLFFIPAGNDVTNPGELVASKGLKKLFEIVTPMFDWVIIDSPPVLPVSDAVVLSDLTDGVLQIVQASSTSYEDAQRACREFQDKNLVGIVLNRAEEGSRNSYYSGYYGNGLKAGR